MMPKPAYPSSKPVIEAVYQREKVTQDLCEEFWPLLKLHYEEIAHFKDIPLEPDFDQYIKSDQQGVLRVYTARLDGDLVGYAIYFVRNNIHYKSSKQAVQDVLFIDPCKRGFGADFILWCDDQLRDEGVEVTYHHVKNAHNFGAMLESMGYRLVDLIYGRKL